MGYYAQLMMAYRDVAPQIALRYARMIIAGVPTPYFATVHWTRHPTQR